ncbi:hypothetical protein [Sphingobacterium bovistauri]|uniref:Uncharacterized protein n=1 Tax=Sphingobacterium bovistauri TaxID=2781959 RepID=A0ABS7ZC22_9SPHI|nr:hypothetical protein [Sphingobacterium bovistauri]
MSQNNPKLIRPEKELKSFIKLYLKSGDKRNVQIPICDIAYYDDKLRE